MNNNVIYASDASFDDCVFLGAVDDFSRTGVELVTVQNQWTFAMVHRNTGMGINNGSATFEADAGASIHSDEVNGSTNTMVHDDAAVAVATATKG